MSKHPSDFCSLDLSPATPKEPSGSLGYTLSWDNLSYSVKTSGGKTKPILKNLHGISRPGTVTAILGASGAGKSSLLDVLAGRKNPAHVSGTVSINGRSDIPIRHVSRYCTQQEALFGNLTTYETLIYAAHFNLPSSTASNEKEEFVQYLLQEFGLTKVKDTIVGTPIRKGCSGGEARRISVAAQLGQRDRILFLDEPTSGLDSVAAFVMIKTLRSLAENSHATILVAIHQPNTAIFELFTHLLILGEGATVYFGPREGAIGYFESIGIPTSIHANPADVYLQLVNFNFDVETSNLSKRKEDVNQLCVKFENSSNHRDITQEISSLKESPLPYTPGSVGYVNGSLYQTTILVKRAFLNATKNPLSYWIRVTMYVALAVLMGTTWLRMDNSQSTVQDRMAGLFFAVAFLSFMSVAGIPAFLEERNVFLKELDNGLYGVGSYVFANLVVSVPFIIIITLSFTGVAYYLMGLQSGADKILAFVGYLFLSLMIAEAQTVFISVAIPVFVGALAITAFTNGLWMIVQGFFVQKRNIPWFWRNTFHQLDFQRYSYELLVSNEMEGLVFDCAGDEVLGCSCAIPPDTYKACTFTGEGVLRYYDYAELDKGTWLAILVAIFFVFKISTYLVLRITASRTKY